MTLPVARDRARSFDFPTFMSSLGRSALAAGLAVLAGGTAAGLTGRLAMRAVAVLDPEATGRLTEAGAVVGTITTEGSVGLVIFGTIFGVLLGSVMVVAFASLIPGGTPVRAILFGLAMVAIFGSVVVTSRNVDFGLFASPAADILLFSAPFMVAGVVAIPVDTWLERRLPAARGRENVEHAYVIVAALALLLVAVTVLGFAGNSDRPDPLLFAMYVTAAGVGILRHALDRVWVPTLGRLVLLVLCGVGGARYLIEVGAILGRAGA
jgi:hypothetical protein